MSDEEKKKEADALKAQEALEESKNKPKTTGNIDSIDDKPSDQLSLEEVGRMSDLEFARLKPAERKKYLRMMKEL